MNKFRVLKSSFSYEFLIYKIILWPCGIWPLEKENYFKVIRYLTATLSQVNHYPSIHPINEELN